MYKCYPEGLYNESQGLHSIAMSGGPRYKIYVHTCIEPSGIPQTTTFYLD